MEEAKTHLKEGNNGFSAVIIKDNNIILRDDREDTESDPASHAELNAIRLASIKYGATGILKNYNILDAIQGFRQTLHIKQKMIYYIYFMKLT